MAEDQDLIAELTEDHRRLDALCVLIKSAPWGDPRRKRLVFRMSGELAEHAAAEGQFLFPAVRTRIHGGRALADRGRDSRTQLDHLVSDLADCAANDRRFDKLVTRLVFGVHHHTAGQERGLFPRLTDAAESGELHTLVGQLRESREVAPGNRGIVLPEPDPSERLLRSSTQVVEDSTRSAGH